MKNKQGQHVAWRLLQGQIGITATLAFGFALIFGVKAFYSAILGGLIAIIPAVFFARILFKHYGAQKARQINRSFYVGEAVKLITTIVLFAVVFIFCKIMPLIFFITYILAQFVMWLMPWINVKPKGLKLIK